MSQTSFVPVVQSLSDLAGSEYTGAVCKARAALTGEDDKRLQALADRPVDFFPRELQERLRSLLPRVGEPFAPGPACSARGATTTAFEAATKRAAAPLNGLGYYRVGEDGRLYIITKSEHYHASLGHSFPGYALLETARVLGIPNATHNNTRGHITCLLEEELVRAANGLEHGDREGLEAVLASGAPTTLNRVLNLETGSLAVEAAFKMALARFYRSQADRPEGPYRGRIPVMLVVGSDEGGPQANYHGTTLLVQTLRGMWPGLAGRMEESGILRVCAVRPNCPEDLDAAFAEYERPPYKIAAFCHEIIMMNYGARLLSPEYLQRAYALCHQHDVPTVCDEIQSCLWAPDLFLFREWGLRPTFLAVGKGFPGGEYPASRLLFSAVMDNLAQFGALVTNGQEELASLAYLITMRWARANAEVTRRIGERYEARLRDFAARHADRVDGVTGWRHLSGIRLHDLETAKSFAARLNRMGLDISVQTYKADAPPIVLTKLPLIAGEGVVDFVLERMEAAITNID